MRKFEVRRKLLGSRVRPLEQALNQNKLKWLGNGLCMLTERLPRCTLFFEGEGGNGWKMVPDGNPMT